MWEYFRQGGPVMWPLLLASVVGLWLIMDRFYYLGRAGADNAALMKRVMTALHLNDADTAAVACRGCRGPAASVLRAGLEALSDGHEAFEKAVREAGNREMAGLERHLDTLAFIANVSPLLGLLGTVTGMIKTFDVFARIGASNPMALAGGIAEALITTAAGLFIAIPVMAAHHYFSGRVDDMMAQADEAASEAALLMEVTACAQQVGA